MRNSTVFTLLLSLAAVFMLPPVVLAEDAAAQGGDKGAYTVIKGDTLWDISGERLSDPFKWPDLWKLNPDIKNPDLIYPGDKIIIPGMAKEPGAPSSEKAGVSTGPSREAAEAEAAGGAPGTARGKEEPFVRMGETIMIEPEEATGKIITLDTGRKVKSPIATEEDILAVGFIADEELPYLGITGSPLGDRQVFTQGDQVFIKSAGGLKPGERYIIFRPLSDLEHPATGDDMGRLISVVGLLRLLEQKDGFMLAEIEKSLYEIYDTDMLAPYETPELVYEPVPKNPSLKNAWGYVVALVGDKIMAGMTGSLYIDMGSDDGVKPGDRFVVRRSGGSAYSYENTHYLVPKEYILPDVEIGEVQVISVKPGSAAARVVASSEPIFPGERVYYKD